MLPGNYFIPGLTSFLVAHLFYIALFRQGQAQFPSRRALFIVVAFGAAMYALLWPSLPDPMLKLAVAAYVAAISLMTAQAIGRAAVLSHDASRWVDRGRGVFMLSDSLIAINKFLQPCSAGTPVDSGLLLRRAVLDHLQHLPGTISQMRCQDRPYRLQPEG